ncbi:MAG TPA: CBS domain-containing protein [archaeon]|nr:CBS domain-containing protein [archaeon]
MRVTDVMSGKPITVTRSHTLNHALDIMAKHNIRECPVIQNGRLLGMISESDITRAADVYNRINKIDDLPFALLMAIKGDYGKMKKNVRQYMNKKVHTIMSKQLVTVSPEDDLYKAMRLINKHNVRSLPVVKNKKLAGIISRSDIIRAMAG